MCSLWAVENVGGVASGLTLEKCERGSGSAVLFSRSFRSLPGQWVNHFVPHVIQLSSCRAKSIWQLNDGKLVIQRLECGVWWTYFYLMHSRRWLKTVQSLRDHIFNQLQLIRQRAKPEMVDFFYCSNSLMSTCPHWTTVQTELEKRSWEKLQGGVEIDESHFLWGM